MGNFLSCDWGTSSFRIRLADIETGEVLAEELSDRGIAGTFKLWNATPNRDETKRIAFYLDVINDHIKELEARTGKSLNGVKVIISGMVSSSIGVINIPYTAIPLDVNKPHIQTAHIPANDRFNHDTWIVSGIKSDNDVTRGEEMQLIGCIDPAASIGNELFIFPGTHSKHIHVKDNQVIGFKTFMTGDLFELLSQKSILGASVEEDAELSLIGNLSAFKKGLKDALDTNLLHAIFKVRINDLLGLLNKKENFNYLSGLLIGTELMDLKAAHVDMINLVGGANLAPYYSAALLESNLSSTVKILPAKWVDEAVVRGQLKIANQLNLLT